MSEAKETRGLPKELYANARLLRLAKLIGITPERILSSPADLDYSMQIVEFLGANTCLDGTWHNTKRRAVVPKDWVEVTPTVARLSLKKANKSDLGNALVARAVVNRLYEGNYHLESRVDSKSKVTFLWVGLVDQSSPNNYGLSLSVDDQRYRIFVKGVGNASKRRKKKRIGKANSRSSEQVNDKTASVEKTSSTVDNAMKDARVKKAMALGNSFDRTDSRSSSGIER